MKLLINSTIPTLCGHRIDVKIIDHTSVREINTSPLETIFTNIRTYTEDLRNAEYNPKQYSEETITERRTQIDSEKHKIFTEAMGHPDINFKPQAREKVIEIIQDLSKTHKPKPIYFTLIIYYKIPRTYHETYLGKIGNKDECEKFAAKLDERKNQQIKREGLQPAINILTCILALIAAIGATPIIINSIIKAAQFIGKIACNIF